MNEFWKGVERRVAAGQRYGQAIFNTLAEVNPVRAERIRGTDLDPFYWEAGVALDRLEQILGEEDYG